MIKMPKLARGCLAGNGVHRSGVKMPAICIRPAWIRAGSAVGGERFDEDEKVGAQAIPKSLPARRIPQCDFAHRK